MTKAVLSLATISFVVAVASVMPPSISFAADDIDEAAALLTRLRAEFPKTNFVAARPSPIEGLFEIEMSSETAYTDADGRHLFIGEIYDLRDGALVAGSRQPSPRAPAVEAKADLFAALSPPRAGPPRPFVAGDERYRALPDNLAVDILRGGARYDREAFLFSDPNCPYCARLEAILARERGLLVRVVFAPFLPGSTNAVSDILCAEDPARAYLARVAGGTRAPPAANADRAECLRRTRAMTRLTRALGVNATPTLLAPNGQFLAGFDADAGRWISENQK